MDHVPKSILISDQNMLGRTDYSYRHPINRGSKFPILAAAQLRQTERDVLTGVSGQSVPKDIHITPNRNITNLISNHGDFMNLIPVERNLTLLHPNRRTDWSYKPARPNNRYSMADFHRYRRLKELQPSLVPRMSDMMAYKYCPTCCTIDVSGCCGCQRDKVYTYYLNQRRMPYTGQRPEIPYGRGYYGYLHETLDNLKTGKYWTKQYSRLHNK